jgi:AmmeMemoRadiSam system protein B
MKNKNLFHFVIVFYLLISGCGPNNTALNQKASVRQLVDTVGFAQYTWQMDSIMARLGRTGWNKTEGLPWRLAICPHDDYAYAGKLYPEILSNIKATNLILIGVAHKAARLGIADSLVFDSYTYWKGPWKNIKISDAREEIYEQIKGKYAIVSDTLHKLEHSLESMIPFLQYFNREVNIIPVLVPAMDSARMKDCSRGLAAAIRSVADKLGWEWGRDYAIIVTTDAVHYGNEGWGGADYAFFGCDENGNIKARQHEAEIIDNCLKGQVVPYNFRLFTSYTLKSDNYRDYKWTWCGRYCIPVALYTSYFLNNSKPLYGELIGYETSITSRHIPVDDIKMGVTAIATDCHWVGYAALGYR